MSRRRDRRAEHELGHEKDDSTLSRTARSTHALHQSNRRFQCVKTNDQIHAADIQTFFTDRRGDEDIVTARAEVVDDFLLQLLIDAL